MKYLSIILFLLISISVQAQPNPEIYLGDIHFSENSFTISNLLNISNNTGYDNQPAFLMDGTGILFSSEYEDATNIKLYTIDSGESRWITNSEGGKYSPTIMPDGKSISSIWLKPDGEQLLWQFPLWNGESKVLVPNEVIGYHAWFDEQSLYTFVLGEHFTLVEFSIGERIRRKVIATNPGRSIHKIPGKEEISFIDKNDSTQWIVKSYDPSTKAIRALSPTPANSEDMTWINSDSFLIGKGNSLLTWKEGHGLSAPTFIFDKAGTISRITLSPDRSKIAIVFTAD